MTTKTWPFWFQTCFFRTGDIACFVPHQVCWVLWAFHMTPTSLKRQKLGCRCRISTYDVFESSKKINPIMQRWLTPHKLPSCDGLNACWHGNQYAFYNWDMFLTARDDKLDSLRTCQVSLIFPRGLWERAMQESRPFAATIQNLEIDTLVFLGVWFGYRWKSSTFTQISQILFFSFF